MSAQDNETANPALTPSSIVCELHQRCGIAVDTSTAATFESLIGQSHTFVGDLESWTRLLADKPEHALLETATHEYVISLLNACEAQYRNAFKGLRLVLELCLQTTFLSANLVGLSEWLRSDADTVWANLIDGENGLLSKRFCKAFLPDLVDHVANFREMAKSVYRELSECIHGNVPNQIPLPQALAFDQATFLLWHEKARVVRLVVLFCLSMRYLQALDADGRHLVESSITDQLGHITALRAMVGGPVS